MLFSLATVANMQDGKCLLAEFLKRNGISQRAAAAALGVSAPNMHDWLAGAKRPRAENRVAIDRWTAGAVPAASWSTPDELSNLETVEPFKASADLDAPIPFAVTSKTGT